MGQRCRTCDHPRRSDLDIALCRGATVAAVAKQFGVSSHSVKRHREAGHIPISVRDAFSQTASQLSAEAMAQLRTEEQQGVLLNLARERGVLFKLQDDCLKRGWRQLALGAAGRIHENVRLTAQVVGEIVDHEKVIAQVNAIQILALPSYVDLRGNLVAALRGHPKAREAVARVLEKIEGEPPHFTGEHPKLIEARADG